MCLLFLSVPAPVLLHLKAAWSSKYKHGQFDIMVAFSNYAKFVSIALLFRREREETVQTFKTHRQFSTGYKDSFVTPFNDS